MHSGKCEPSALHLLQSELKYCEHPGTKKNPIRWIIPQHKRNAKTKCGTAEHALGLDSQVTYGFAAEVEDLVQPLPDAAIRRGLFEYNFYARRFQALDTQSTWMVCYA